MALSNILKEPRREITEQLVGTTLGGFIVCLDVIFARWFAYATYLRNADGSWYMMLIVGLILGVSGSVVMVGLIFLAHQMGEAACNALEARDVHLRPRRRY